MDKKPAAYMTLLGKILPSQAHLTGGGGGPAELRIRWMMHEEALSELE